MVFGLVAFLIVRTGGLDSPFACHLLGFPILAIVIGNRTLPIIMFLGISFILSLFALDFAGISLTTTSLPYPSLWKALALTSALISISLRTRAFTQVLRQALESELRASAIKSLFVANMSHGNM